MDFQELLNVADYNRSEAKSEASVKRYTTVLAPPKKAPKSGVQSDAIKNFLLKRQAEEQQKVVEARKKKEELLALRSQNSKNSKKAKIMASRTKDNDFSKIKLTEDEIESKKRREGELLRMKLNDKVARMKARIEMEEREKLLPKKRKRKSKHVDENEGAEEFLSEEEDKYIVETSKDVNYKQGDKIFMHNGEHNADIAREQKRSVKRRPLLPNAPAISFQDLLRVAATKQFEPVEVPEFDDDDDDYNERPLTKKEKRLLQEEETRILRKQTQQPLSNSSDHAQKKNGADSKSISNRPHELKMLHKTKPSTKNDKRMFDQDRNSKTKQMYESAYNRNNSNNTHEIYVENKHSNEISKREMKSTVRSDYHKYDIEVTRQQSKQGNITQRSSKSSSGNVSEYHLNSELRHPAGYSAKNNISRSNESYENAYDSDCNNQAFKKIKLDNHISNRELKSPNQSHQKHSFKQKTCITSLVKYNVEDPRKHTSLNNSEDKQLRRNMVSEKEMYLKRGTERDMKVVHKSNSDINKSPVKHANVEFKQKTVNHSNKRNNSSTNKGVVSDAFSTKLNGQSKSFTKNSSPVNGYNKNANFSSKRIMEEREYLPAVSPPYKVLKLDKRLKEKPRLLPGKNIMKHKKLFPASEKHSVSNKNIPPTSDRNMQLSSNRHLLASTNRNALSSTNKCIPPSDNRSSTTDRLAHPASNKQRPLLNRKASSDRLVASERKPSELRPCSKPNNLKMMPHENVGENRPVNKQSMKGDTLSTSKNEAKKPFVMSKAVKQTKQENSNNAKTLVENVPNIKIPPGKNKKQATNKVNSAKSQIGKQTSFHSRPYESQHVPSKNLPLKSNKIGRDSYPVPRNPYLDPPRRLLESRRPTVMQQRQRIESDDDEDDDMSDFIDDGPCIDENDDYSKYIKEIFGYDRSRYLDEDDDDDEVMETSYAEQQKEEIRSAKIGHLEDLEDIRREEEELKRKQIRKKKKKI